MAKEDIKLTSSTYDKNYIEQRGRELAKKHKDTFWKLADKEDFVWQWDSYKEYYVPEYSDKQL